MERACGILMHITSLPEKGRGTLDGAKSFIDLLRLAGQSYWQILPINPVGEGGSPYYSTSVFAGGEHLTGSVPESFSREAFADFSEREADWLNDYALFTVIKRTEGGKPFCEWSAPLKNRETAALLRFSALHEKEINAVKLAQFRFFEKWADIKRYAGENGIKIIGDIPFYTAPDSADVWANPELFDFDAVGGCPPDCYAKDGQLWGNPVYDFASQRRNGYEWWLRRFSQAASLFDAVRVDHFRGFESFFAIPAGDKDAKKGEWRRGPSYELFDRLFLTYPDMRLIAEDLGFLTPEVYALRDRYGIMGTKVLEFAFDEDMTSIYLPHNIDRNSVIYTGTHDNDTANGWFSSLEPECRELFAEYSGKSASESAADALLRLAYSSVARLAVIPLQDALGLTDARMNTPGTVSEKNWVWQLKEGEFGRKEAERLAKKAALFSRN